MKKTLAAATILIALGLAAPAMADSAMKEAFANTLTTTVDGQTTKWFFNEDGTFTATEPDGAQIAGAWTEADGKVCVTPSGGEPACAAVEPGKKVGDTWTATNDAGESMTVSIMAGRP